MANFFVPSKQILTPELLIPGRKPNGPVVVDRTKTTATAFWLMRERGGQVRDVLEEEPGILSGTVEQSAKGLEFTDGQVTLSDRPVTATSKLAAFFLITPTAAASDYRTILCQRDGSSVSFQFRLDKGVADRQISFYWVHGGTWQKYEGTPVYITNDERCFVGFSFDWAAPGTVDIWHNSSKTVVSRSSGSSTTPNAIAVPWTIGRRDNSSMEFTGGIHSGWMFDGCIPTDQEILGLYHNPNVSLQPPGPEYLTFSTGAGATVLSIADLAHAHALDNVALTQAQLLSIADSTHAHTLDNVALTQAQVLAIAGALHAHGLDAMTLQTGDTLIIAGLDHAHTLDPANLVQAQVLAIADVLHTHTLDGMTLDVGEVTLVISDLLHAHLLDACNVYPLDSVDTPAGRVFLIEHESRIFAVAAESRIFNVQ